MLRMLIARILAVTFNNIDGANIIEINKSSNDWEDKVYNAISSEKETLIMLS